MKFTFLCGLRRASPSSSDLSRGGFFTSGSCLFSRSSTFRPGRSCRLLCPSSCCASRGFLRCCRGSSIRRRRLRQKFSLRCCRNFPACSAPPGCAILFRSLLSVSLHHDDFLITHRVLSYTWHDHQPAAVRTEFGYWLFPDSKVAGGVVTTPVKDAFLLLCLTFYEVALTHRTQRTGFIHNRATIAAFGKARAGDKAPKTTRTNNEVASTLGAGFINLFDWLLYPIHLSFGLIHRHLKIVIEAAQEPCPGLPPFFDIVELSLHFSRETCIYNIRKVLIHHFINRLA